MSLPFLPALNIIPYNLTNTYDENVEQIRENFPDRLPLLETEFPSPQRTLTIYYPFADQFHPITYNLPSTVTPRLILESISNFYQQDLPEAYVAYLLKAEFSLSDLEERKVWNTLGTQVFLEGMEPYNNGWLLILGT